MTMMRSPGFSCQLCWPVWSYTYSFCLLSRNSLLWGRMVTVLSRAKRSDRGHDDGWSSTQKILYFQWWM